MYNFNSRHLTAWETQVQLIRPLKSPNPCMNFFELQLKWSSTPFFNLMTIKYYSESSVLVAYGPVENLYSSAWDINFALVTTPVRRWVRYYSFGQWRLMPRWRRGQSRPCWRWLRWAGRTWWSGGQLCSSAYTGMWWVVRQPCRFKPKRKKHFTFKLHTFRARWDWGSEHSGLLLQIW